MKFLKDWKNYLVESLDLAKKTEIAKKRQEIQNKISQIEGELTFIKSESDDKIVSDIIGDNVTTTDVNVESNVDVNVEELVMKLESLKSELNDLESL